LLKKLSKQLSQVASSSRFIDPRHSSSFKKICGVEFSPEIISTVTDKVKKSQRVTKPTAFKALFNHLFGCFANQYPQARTSQKISGKN
jgi:hypothetical protein